MSLFGFDEATKVFLYTQATDMRKGFDGLYGLVLDALEMDPRLGYLFVFINKQGTRIKILHWQSDGLAIFHKRLEQGTFRRPTSDNGALKSELTKEALFMILRGIDFRKTKKRKRYLAM
jgi:transposase